ncbi:hypothetical protein ACN28S_14650 [Cystobacter fuscus]
MEARQLTPSPRVVEVTDRAAFMALEPEWNALVQATADEPFYRHEFFRIWIDDFAPEARLRVLTLRDGEGRLTAVLPLMAERASLYGVPGRQLSATANPHSCRFDLVAREPAEAAAVFFSHLRADKGWDVLRLTDVPEGGAGWHLYEAAKGRGCPWGRGSPCSRPTSRCRPRGRRTVRACRPSSRPTAAAGAASWRRRAASRWSAWRAGSAWRRSWRRASRWRRAAGRASAARPWRRTGARGASTGAGAHRGV